MVQVSAEWLIILLFSSQFYFFSYLYTVLVTHWVGTYSGFATGRGGASRATCPPPQPPIGHPVRSMQIQGDFRV